MDNTFIEICRKMSEEGINTQDKAAFDSIVETLIKKNRYGNDKITDLDGYDGEKLFGNTTLYPGCIYIFQYAAKNPILYDDGRDQFYWFDSLPIVLVTGFRNRTVSGINLNMCNMAVKTQIINSLYNLDPQFYKEEAEQMVIKGQKPYSNNVSAIFLDKNKEKAFYDHITRICKLKDTSFIYRTYSISNILNPRMVEVWQYKYIPFLRYTGELKNEILTRIWNISGMADYKI